MPLWNAKTRQVSKLQINFLTTKHVNIFNPNPLITCLISVKCGHFCKPFNFLKSMSPVLNRLSDRPGHNKVLPTLTLVRIRQEGTHFITVGLISSTLSDYETKHQLMRRNKDKVICKTYFQNNYFIRLALSGWNWKFCVPPLSDVAVALKTSRATNWQIAIKTNKQINRNSKKICDMSLPYQQ